MSISNYGYWNVQKRPQPSKKPSENVQKPPKMPKMLKKMKNPQNRPKCQKRQILSWVSSLIQIRGIKERVAKSYSQKIIFLASVRQWRQDSFFVDWSCWDTDSYIQGQLEPSYGYDVELYYNRTNYESIFLLYDSITSTTTSITLCVRRGTSAEPDGRDAIASNQSLIVTSLDYWNLAVNNFIQCK